ncbi:hypothetical protein [Chryseobacterium polytrichastri]|uniref:Uncharacterized protein n=1 Tax=Chryseobacterium polytrichastri TaxID=1302687 RepID=A0A1M6YVG2_9FLAO|nr:hypothetical protein [Chryseobacterium polytrichastri]SHL22256.1 hypothetical protein SAMN05444267_101430 [Chryseobacterium polytrichastri]
MTLSLLEIQWEQTQSVAAYVAGVVSIISLIWTSIQQRKIENIRSDLAEKKVK